MSRAFRHFFVLSLAAVLCASVVGAASAAELVVRPPGVQDHDDGRQGHPRRPLHHQEPEDTGSPQGPRQLGPVDLILVVHGHPDHIGDTAVIAKATGAKVAMNSDMGHTFAALGWVPYEQLIRFNKSGPIHPLGPEITITMVGAVHSSDVVHKDEHSKKKTMHAGGEPAGYIVELENGDKIYHAGDTEVFADMVFVGSYYKPDLALLPISGQFTMDRPTRPLPSETS